MEPLLRNKTRLALQLVAAWLASDSDEKRVCFAFNDGRKRHIKIRHDAGGCPVLGDVLKCGVPRTVRFRRAGHELHGDEPLGHGDVISVDDCVLAPGAQVVTVKTWGIDEFAWESTPRGHPRWPGVEGTVTEIDAGTREARLRFRIPFGSLDSPSYTVRIPLDKIQGYIRVLAVPTVPTPMSLRHKSGGPGSLEQLVALMTFDEGERDILSAAYKQRAMRDGAMAMREQSRRRRMRRYAQRMEDVRSICHTCSALRDCEYYCSPQNSNCGSEAW